MNWIQELTSNEPLRSRITAFLQTYGTPGLEKALQFYAATQEDYICKTKKSISKVKISEIYYLEIQKHNISIHTEQDTYQKYGTLNTELKRLSSHNFMKCNQSCLVSLDKIRTIQSNDVILLNNAKIHMSRNCAPKILIAFSNKRG